jgi:methyl coenzyme M reductase subunit C-like uncharacterized protein (methanogenesis marker protein 7)
MTDDLRDRLATEIGETLLDLFQQVYGHRMGDVAANLTGTALGVDARAMADALLPFVRAEIARELRQQAGSTGDVISRARLRSRADELDPERSPR